MIPNFSFKLQNFLIRYQIANQIRQTMAVLLIKHIFLMTHVINISLGDTIGVTA